MKANLSLAGTLFMAALLSGCGSDTLQIDGANAVATTSATVVTQANAALDTAKARRERAYDILIASDPNCPLEGDVYTFTPTQPPAPGAPLAPICAKDAKDTFAGYRATRMNAPLVGPATLRPTIALLGAVADYQAALAKVTAEAKPDLTKQLQAIADKANDARVFAELVSSSTLPNLPDLSSKQAKAATDILQFIAAIYARHGQAEEIKKIVIAQRSKFAELGPQLKAQMDEWQSITTQGYSQVIEADLRRIYAQEKSSADFVARLQLVTSIRQAEADKALVPKTTEALKKAIDKFTEADATLGNRVDGKLSEEDRKKAADVSLSQIFDGLHLIAAAVAAWGFV